MREVGAKSEWTVGGGEERREEPLGVQAKDELVPNCHGGL